MFKHKSGSNVSIQFSIKNNGIRQKIVEFQHKYNGASVKGSWNFDKKRMGSPLKNNGI